PITTWTMGPIPASGSLTRPFPIRGPRTPGGFVGAQFQAYTNVGWPVYRSGVQRMVVVHPSL
ncbi:MAG: hypothetical protein P1V35_17370, partial [Planctomycetota bacterium]|nr:hypothetical protein [Planctomycetota bacterium]